MANEYDLPDDLLAAQQQLTRQQKLADMLMAQNQQPQGQMISGRYVAPSIFQQLQPVANMLTGAYLSNKSDERANALAKQIRELNATESANILGKLYGQEAVQAVPEKVTELAGPYTGDIPKPVAYQAPVQGRAAVPGSTEAAYLEAMKGYTPASKEMAAILRKQLVEPKWEKSERTIDGVKQTGFVNMNSQNPASTFRLAGSSPDVEIAKGIYEGYLPSNQGSSSFNNAVNKVFTLEGGYVASDGKSNAPTNFGINQRANPDIDVKNLTKDQAAQIYKTRYWDAIGGDQLPPKTAEIAFDAAVNQGVDYARKLLQATGGDPNRMLQQRAVDYQNIVKNDPTQAKFLPSWTARLNSYAQADNKYLPANLPQYKDDPSLSPKENAQARAKFNTENQNAVKNAENSFGLLKSATDILNTNAPSSGRGENIITGTREFFGGGGEASKADAQLKILGNKLTAQVPRFEGPQSDKDTAIYQAAAGDLQNPNIPIQTRLAAVDTMIGLNKKYYPNGDWDSIDTGGAVVRKNILGGTRGLGAQTMTPQQFAEGLNTQDKEAFTWARKNPTDPRSTQILKKLGID